jgi:hypothetical protein
MPSSFSLHALPISLTQKAVLMDYSDNTGINQNDVMLCTVLAPVSKEKTKLQECSDPEPDLNPDPYLWLTDPDPGHCMIEFLFQLPGFRIRIDLMRNRIRIRIQHYFLLRIRIPDPDPGFDDLKLKKITAEIFFFFFWSKTTIYLSLGLHKGRPSYRRSLQPSKKTSSTSKHENSVLFSIFVGHFFPPGSGFGSAIWMRIRIRIQ